MRLAKPPHATSSLHARLTLGRYARGMFAKYQGIFRSRWRALFWASGVLLTAYCTVPSEDGSDPAMDLLQTAAGYAGEKPPPKHVNPWALQKPPAKE